MPARGSELESQVGRPRQSMRLKQDCIHILFSKRLFECRQEDDASIFTGPLYAKIETASQNVSDDRAPGLFPGAACLPRRLSAAA
jgi:hypothetical protein